MDRWKLVSLRELLKFVTSACLNDNQLSPDTLKGTDPMKQSEPARHASLRSGTRNVVLLVTVVCVAFTTACVTTVGPGTGTVGGTYFGIVHLRLDKTASGRDTPILTASTTTLGIRIGNGVTVGLLQGRELRLPMDCRVVFLVRTDEQLKEAVSRLASISENPCISVDRSF